MIFSSVSFLFFFLPLVLGITFASPARLRNGVLLVASLVFYAWGEGIYTLLLAGSILCNHVLAPRLEDGSSRRGPLLVLGVLLNLAPLAFFKYAVFFSTIPAALWGTPVLAAPHLPAGISFFTFQAISYLVDVYRGEARAERSVVNCGLYISMFPQLIAGPIVRFHDIARELRSRRVDMAGFAAGVERFIFGLGKKVLLADALGERADALFALPPAELGAAGAWLAALCFSLQIYYDFSGYSDMAIGLGRMFGFHLPENFNYPYVSRSIREFWRRWHISLSTWLRDYLYIPLGGNRGGRARTLANLLVVFLLCGLWHGAAWTFVLWGLWHGIFLVIERCTPRVPGPVAAVLGRIYALAVILAGWVLFRSPDVAAAMDHFRAMAGLYGPGQAVSLAAMLEDPRLCHELGFGLALALPLYPALRSLGRRLPGPGGALVQEGLRLASLCAVAYFALLVIAVRAYHPFLYFQF